MRPWREIYYTCSIEEIIGKFHGMTKFTIADFNKGYWMVELDPESRKYMMALDIGRFQWMRLPMDSIVAQDVFQRKLDAIFLSIPGVTGIADNMIIYGKTNQEHDQHLVNFLEVCRKKHIDFESKQDARGFVRYKSYQLLFIRSISEFLKLVLQEILVTDTRIARGWDGTITGNVY